MTVPPEKWVQEIPFDFPDPDKPLGYPGGVFASEQELREAMKAAEREDFPEVLEADLK